MTVPPASSLRSRFLLGLDSSAPTAPPPSPWPPPPTCAYLHRHTTQHTSRALVARVGNSFPLVSVPGPPSPPRAFPRPPDKADVPLSCTPCLLHPCSLGGGGHC